MFRFIEIPDLASIDVGYVYDKYRVIQIAFTNYLCCIILYHFKVHNTYSWGDWDVSYKMCHYDQNFASSANYHDVKQVQ